MFRLLTDEQQSEIAAVAFELLERVGVKLIESEAQALLYGAGAHVEGGRVYVPARLTINRVYTNEACKMRDNSMKGIRMEAAIIFEPHIPTALRRALRYAGDDGFVASMPQLLHARANAPYDNILWNTWFTSYTEESVVTTPQGNRVVVAVHGGGIFTSPERFERSYYADLDRSNPEGLTGQNAAKITAKEARDVLEGKLPDGTEIPIFPFDEFKRGVADLRYGVILDFDLAKQAENGYVAFETLKDEPNMIVRAGGVEPLAAYLDKAQARNNTKLMGNWHPYNRIDPDQPQTRVVFLAGNKGGVGSEGDDIIHGFTWGYDAEYGMGGDASMVNMGRYVAVAPRNVATSLRYLDFELETTK